MSNLVSRIHEILGPLAPNDAERLKTSIDRDGVILPVVIRKSTGEIIDGKHRASLASDYPTIELDLDEREAARQVVSLNLARRHVSNEQRREIIRLLREAKFTQREVAEMVGVTQGRISQAEADDISSNIAPLSWNEANQSYEAPQEKSEPREIEMPDLRYRGGTRKVTPKQRRRKKEYRDGVLDAKKKSKCIPYFAASNFTPEGLKRFLELAGAPKSVLKNSHRISEVNFSISEVSWHANLRSAEDPLEALKLNGRRDYIDQENADDE